MRARNIKPAFFTDERLAGLKPLARILFIGLWCLADRRGRLEDRPARIKVEVLPYDNCNVSRILDDLARLKKIVRYEGEDGHRYIQIVKFAKHQNPHIREHESTIAPPPGFPEDRVIAPVEHHAKHSAGHSAKHVTSHADSGFRIPDSLIPDSPVSDSAAPEQRAESPASPRPPSTPNGREEVPSNGKSGCGQDWANHAWVEATAELVGLPRRMNEPFDDWADRVSMGLKTHTQASEAENERRQMLRKQAKEHQPARR